jgi:hypothetical protein
MERQESGGFHQRPEFSKETPERIFEYAKAKQQWAIERVSPERMGDSVAHAVEELDHYLATCFDGLPEIQVQTDDARQTQSFKDLGNGEYHIQSSLIPLEGDAKILGEHTLRGTLFGFHRGSGDDIRFYLAQSSPIPMDAGVYTPLVSIGVAGSLVTFGDQLRANEESELQRKGAFIQEKLAEYGPETRQLVGEMIRLLNQPELATVDKLHRSAPIVVELSRSEEVTQQFIDAILDYIRVKLGLTSAQNIKTSSHRVTMTRHPVRSYIQRGEAEFNNVVPQLDLMKANKSLGLIISHADEAIVIPVEYLKVVEKSIG